MAVQLLHHALDFGVRVQLKSRNKPMQVKEGQSKGMSYLIQCRLTGLGFDQCEIGRYLILVLEQIV